MHSSGARGRVFMGTKTYLGGLAAIAMGMALWGGCASKSNSNGPQRCTAGSFVLCQCKEIGKQGTKKCNEGGESFAECAPCEGGGGGGGETDSGVNQREAPDGEVKSDARSGGNTGTDCTGPLVAGDLYIVEFMLATLKGAPDFGEWIE